MNDTTSLHDAVNPNDTLVVDLDGTLLQSDMLFETFWNALGRNFFNAVKAAFALKRGITDMKQCLREASDVDVTTLPYNRSVIEFIESWREAGGRTALVTATDSVLAERIANHLGLFDDVFGTSAEVNLKSDKKAQFLQRQYPGGYTYMGDSHADIAVWKHANHAISVNASSSVRGELAALPVSASHIEGSKRELLKNCLRAMRPHQWLKNTLIFVPILAAHKTDPGSITTAIVAFVAFSLIASSVYLFNDLLDLGNDRRHPRKCERPLAAGDVPIATGSLLAVAILLLGIALSMTLNGRFVAVIFAYFTLTTLYSLQLKRIVVVDIIVLAMLYTTRIVAGSVATGTVISEWLLAFSMFFFLSLAAIKRQAELMDNQERGKSKPAGRGYRTTDLQVISQISISAGFVSVLVMALYVQSPDVVQYYSQPKVLLGVCLVLLYWLSRIMMVTHRGGMHDDPIVYSAKDKDSYICFVITAVFFLYAH